MWFPDTLPSFAKHSSGKLYKKKLFLLFIIFVEIEIESNDFYRTNKYVGCIHHIPVFHTIIILTALADGT
jgi:hypothetical protein